MQALGDENDDDLKKSTPIPDPQPAFQKQPNNKLKILVVEDNRINQMIIQSILEKGGYEPVVVNNGLEALKTLQEETHDLILMDVQMPEMDGYAATHAIRSSNDWYRTVPIIAMTANAMKGDREKCLDAGMSDYLSKPINPDELFIKINHIHNPGA